MDIDQWGRFLGGVAGVAAVFVTVGLAVRKATDREAVAQRRASESLALLKAWQEVELREDEHSDERARQSFRRELIDRASHFTQVYASVTQPYVTSYWQPTVFGVLSFAWVGAVFFGLLGPVHQGSLFWLLLFFFLCLGVGGTTAVMIVKVSQYKQEAKALRSARKRRGPVAKGFARGKEPSKNQEAVAAVDRNG
ncbi:hypothetical protein ACIQH5_13580 [Paenarthrobacter sp. NPDC091711]|uniref:hypothetical protein n=1 Tax=Paenarthrobacter sp. NPDC091711 TaxID=3364385 RepID=UPI00381CDE78